MDDATRIRIRKRLVPYSILIFAVWPVFATLTAAIEFRQIPYLAVSWQVALLGAAAGTLLLLPDFIVIGSGLGFFAIVLYSIFDHRELLRSTERFIFEPALLFVAVILGTALFYPSIIGLSSMALLHGLSFWVAILTLAGFLCLGCAFLARTGARHIVFGSILTFGLLAPLPVTLRSSFIPIHFYVYAPKPPPLVLLGLDSLSQHDDLNALRSWAVQHGGTWYSKPVPPGLITNSVWTSLLTMKPVREHGVFHVFQSYSFNHRSDNVVSQAKESGYWTVSVFTDQLTCWVGSTFGFDEDRSGAVGWRQLATSLVSNSSLLLPVFRPVLPRLPLSAAPNNHAGTFTYDIDRELNEIFTYSHAKGPVLVAAHTTYLHSPVYPRITELSWTEWIDVVRAPVKLLRDRSFDWQDADRPTDPIPLRRWKVRRLQKAVMNSLERTEFIQSGGKLALFSDHGDRAGITLQNFTDAKYHRILLITFGLQAKNPEAPMSLIEVVSLLGVKPKTGSLPARLEFTLTEAAQWPLLAKTARPQWNGTVQLDENLLKATFRTLKSYEPWAQPDAEKPNHVKSIASLP